MSGKFAFFNKKYLCQAGCFQAKVPAFLIKSSLFQAICCFFNKK
jgi:hypothetical protein